MIVSSTYKEGPTQVDGRRHVYETHIDSENKKYVYEWLGDQNADIVVQERAERLNALIAEKQAAQALVSGTRLPLSKYEFRKLFTDSEKAAIDAFELSFETHPALSDSQKAMIRTGFKDFEVSQVVEIPFKPGVKAMLDLFEAIGMLTAARKGEILLAGS